MPGCSLSVENDKLELKYEAQLPVPGTGIQHDFDDTLVGELERALSDKQKKVVNFFVGKTMGELKKLGKNGADPALIRKLTILKLAILTHEDV